MTWNGSGTYTAPAATFPEVNGTVIDAGRYNPTILDLAAGITAALAKNGENVPTANLSMGGFKHTAAADASGNGQYIVYGQITPVMLGVGGLTVNGPFVTTSNTTIGDAAGDSLTIAPTAITWTGTPVHAGNHTFSGGVTCNAAFTGSTGIFNIGAGQFYKDASGNIFVGTPGSVAIAGKFQIVKWNTAGGDYLAFNNRGTNSSHTNTYNIGGIVAAGWRDVSDPAYVASIEFERTSAVAGAASAGAIVFKTDTLGQAALTSLAEVLRIQSDGHTVPGANATYAMGTAIRRWLTVYGVNADFTGTITGATGSFTNLSGALPAPNLTGNLAVGRFNGGTGAGVTTFWRGDGTWAAPSEALSSGATIGGISAGYRTIPVSGNTGTWSPSATHTGTGIVQSDAATVTINTGVAAGVCVTIANNNAGSMAMTQGGGMTLRWAGTTSTGSRTLAPRALVNVLFISTTEAWVSGSGLS